MLTAEQKKNLREVLAANFLNGNKMHRQEIKEKTGVSVALITYYRVKWGYAKKQKGKRSVSEHMSLSMAIEICKKNGLKITREKTVIEEL